MAEITLARFDIMLLERLIKQGPIRIINLDPRYLPDCELMVSNGIMARVYVNTHGATPEIGFGATGIAGALVCNYYGVKTVGDIPERGSPEWHRMFDVTGCKLPA